VRVRLPPFAFEDIEEIRWPLARVPPFAPRDVEEIRRPAARLPSFACKDLGPLHREVLLLMSLGMSQSGPATGPAERACDEDLLWVATGFHSVDEAGFCVLETWIGSSLRRF
jgi:hypothetical protein